MPWYKQLLDGLIHHLEVWRSAWREQKLQEPIKVPEGKEIEFLPAVLEVIEKPPSPIGRTIGLIIITLFVVTIIWACIGKIDIVAVAQGKIITSDRSKIIQPLETGVVSVIHVKEGQAVKKGQALLELDTTSTDADEARLSHEQLSASTEAARLRALIEGKTTINIPAGTDEKLRTTQEKMLQDQLAEHNARIEVAKMMIEQRQAAYEVTEENISHLSEAVPLLQERVESVSKMVEKNYLSRMQYLEVQESYLEKAQELAAYKKQRAQNKAALNEAKQQLLAIKAEFNKINRNELTNAELRAKSLTKELVKATNRTGYQRLTSPIDGVVQQMMVHTVGGVVTPAQQLMVIVPKEGRFEVEAWVENKDIGFVNEQQQAEIKVESFPFTKYGTVDGEILTLSTDAVPLENKGFAYAARVRMSKATMQVGDKIIDLSPGMNVTVEVKTGTRRLIEYFLSPLLRGLKETARER